MKIVETYLPPPPYAYFTIPFSVTKYTKLYFTVAGTSTYIQIDVYGTYPFLYVFRSFFLFICLMNKIFYSPFVIETEYTA